MASELLSALSANRLLMTTCSYAAVYEVVRGASGLGAGNGPVRAFLPLHRGFADVSSPSQMISLHDGFQKQELWYNFLEGSDRVALDTHSYLCFTEPNVDPLPLQALKVRSLSPSRFSFSLSLSS